MEISKIVENTAIVIKSLAAFGNLADAIEDGHSFAENALKKAQHYFQLIQKPVMADDSGLVVPALNGDPGIFSARYAGPESDYDQNNLKLLREMQGLEKNARKAYFVCAACFYNGSEVVQAEGRIHGIITTKLAGTHGFGYDPLFYIPEYGKTFAEMAPELKNNISHRYLAFSNLLKKILLKS